METSTPPPIKKGLGPLAWIGIGCGALTVLIIIGFVIAGVTFGGKAKQFFEEAGKNPTRASAQMMVTVGVADMVAEDDAKLRYTVKEKQSGKLTTFYWDERSKAPAQVDGDFSAIPATEPVIDSAPVPDTEPVPALPAK